MHSLRRYRGLTLVLIVLLIANLFGCSGGGGSKAGPQTPGSSARSAQPVSPAQSQLLGDMDDDGAATVGDAIKILRIVVGLDADDECADANENGSTDVGDAIKVLRCVVGLDTWPIWLSQDISTNALNCAVDTGELNVDPSTINVASSWRPTAQQGPGDTLQTEVTTDRPQMVVAEDGVLRGLALSLPTGISPTATSPLQINAESTALSLVFMTPGIISTDPAEAQDRATEIKNMPEFTPLVDTLRGGLASQSLPDVVASQAYQNALTAVVEAWWEAHRPADTQWVITDFPKADFTVHVGDDSNPAATEITLRNDGWRYVHVARQDVTAGGSQISLTTVNENMAGAIPVSWGSLFTGNLGAPTFQPDSINFSADRGCKKARYWIVGPGSAHAPGHQSPPSGVPSWHADALGLSIVHYCVLPLVDLIVGVTGRQTEAKAGLMWDAVKGSINLNEAAEACNSGNSARMATALANSSFGIIKFALSRAVMTWLPASVGALLSVIFLSTQAVIAAANFYFAVSCWFSLPLSTCLEATYYPEDDNGGDGPIEVGYEFVTKWGEWGAGDGRFRYPCGVAVDAHGNVYVADQLNDRIQKFTGTGTFITKWGSEGDGDGQFCAPMGVAVDAGGHVYVTDHRMYRNHRIQKFTSDGTFITKWGSYGSGDGQLNQPWHVTLDAHGNVYVADAGNTRVQKFTSTGTFITKWGSYGDGDGQFDYPSGVAVDADGNVFVPDSYNRRIQKFTSTGTFITKWGSKGRGDGQFDYPKGVAVDADGNLYVADWGNYRIQKFTGTGIFIAKWGSPGNGDGQFDWPSDVAVDATGNVYVADMYNHRIQKFRPVVP